jgi:hypothetical protein
MWAIATIFHIASEHSWDHSIHKVLLTFSAIWLLFRPASVPRLLLLAALQIYAVGIDSPGIPNHWLFTSFVNLTVIGAWGFLVLKTHSFAIERDTLLQTFAPLVRIELLTLYFFAVLHKLNTDWFAPQLSCANYFYLGLVERLPFLSQLAVPVRALPHLALAAEAAIPVLLYFRRTRLLGVWLGLIFHGLLVLNPLHGFYNFSSMIFALLVLFVPGSRMVQLQTWIRESPLRTQLTRLTMLPFSWTVLLGYAAFGVASLLLLTILSRYVARVFAAFWIPYCLAMMTLFGVSVTIARKDSAPRYGVFTVRHWGLLWLPLIVFVNGLSPYLGLKTETAFSMFSNLRTEGAQSNHFFIPASIQVFEFQKDLVEVTGSSDKRLQALADEELLIPYFELLRRQPMASVSFIRDGVEMTMEAFSSDRSDQRQPPMVLRKLLRFRLVDKSGGQKCGRG